MHKLLIDTDQSIYMDTIARGATVWGGGWSWWVGTQLPALAGSDLHAYESILIQYAWYHVKNDMISYRFYAV